MQYYARAIYTDSRLGIGSNSLIINDLKTRGGAIRRAKRWSEANNIRDFVLFACPSRYDEKTWRDVYHTTHNYIKD